MKPGFTLSLRQSLPPNGACVTAPGLSARLRSLIAVLLLLTALSCGASMSAFAQGMPSLPGTPATATNEDPLVLECLASFQRAIEQIAALQEQQRKLEELIARQKELISAQETQAELYRKELEALKAALKAESEARRLETLRADLAEKRLQELSAQLEKLKSRSKWKTLGSFAIGFALGAVAAGGNQ